MTLGIVRYDDDDVDARYLNDKTQENPLSNDLAIGMTCHTCDPHPIKVTLPLKNYLHDATRGSYIWNDIDSCMDRTF